MKGATGTPMKVDLFPGESMSRWIGALSAALSILVTAGLPAAALAAPAATKSSEMVTVGPPVPLSATQLRQLADKARSAPSATAEELAALRRLKEGNATPGPLARRGAATERLGPIPRPGWSLGSTASQPTSRSEAPQSARSLPATNGTAEIRRAPDASGTRGAKGDEKRRIGVGPAEPAAAELAKRGRAPAKGGPR